MQATYSTTLQASPEQLVFGRDMIVRMQHTANWRLIESYKQKIALNNNFRENAKRIEHILKIGDCVLLDYKHRKLEAPYEGPYEIKCIFSNGVVEVQKDAISQKVNI